MSSKFSSRAGSEADLAFQTEKISSKELSEDMGQLWESELPVNGWPGKAGLTFSASTTCQVPIFMFYIRGLI